MSEVPRPNKPCPCGSGRRFKRCCAGRKPRHVTVTSDFGIPVSVRGIRLKPDGTVEWRGATGEVLTAVDSTLETAYPRAKGPKTLHRLSMSGVNVPVDINRALLNYDFILAVDTNTRHINDVDVSVAAIAQCFLEREVQIGRLTGSFGVRLALEYESLTNPELVSWRETIRLILASPTYRSGQTVALIVDSELGRLPDVNARRLPIVDDFYLPAGFTLTYASADTGKESIPNRLISLCDREAGRVLGLAALNPCPRSVGSRCPDRPSRVWNVGDSPKP